MVKYEEENKLNMKVEGGEDKSGSTNNVLILAQKALCNEQKSVQI